MTPRFALSAAAIPPLARSLALDPHAALILRRAIARQASRAVQAVQIWRRGRPRLLRCTNGSAHKPRQSYQGKSIVAHHWDYSRPLDVAWLCIGCHGAWHAEFDALFRGLPASSQAVIRARASAACVRMAGVTPSVLARGGRKLGRAR